MSEAPRARNAKPSAWSVAVDAILGFLAGGIFEPVARVIWCRRQRRHLRRDSDQKVVWVRGVAVPWAEWGARHGYFEVERISGFACVSAMPALPVAA